MFLWLVSVCVCVWTALAGASILRQDGLQATARAGLCAAAARLREAHHWATQQLQSAEKRRKEEEAKAEAAAAAAAAAKTKAAETNNPHAPTELRVLRQIVQPRQRQSPSRNTHRGRHAAAQGGDSAAASDAVAPLFAEPAPLQFAVELAWRAPRAVLQGERAPVTYEVRLQPQDATAVTDGSEVADTTSSKPVAPLPDVPSLPVNDSSPMEDALIDEEANAVEQKVENKRAHPVASSAPEVHRFTQAVEQALSSSMVQGEGEFGAPSRKRKHSRSRSRPRSNSAASHRRVGSRGRKASVADSATSSQDEAEVSPADELPILLESTGTFEQPHFVLRDPRALSYRVEVQSSPESDAAAATSGRPSPAVSVSSAYHFTFRLPQLLYLVQCPPRSEAHAKQALAAYDSLLRELTPRDELSGVDWNSLTSLCQPTFSGEIHRHACVVIGRLAATPSILQSLCSNAELLRALHSLVEKRITHMSHKEEEERAAKRQRSQHEEQTPAAPQAETPRVEATPISEQPLQTPRSSAVQGWPQVTPVHCSPVAVRTSVEQQPQPPSSSPSSVSHASLSASSDDTAMMTDGECAGSAAPTSHDFLEPVLENVLSFCLAAVELHTPHSSPAGAEAEDDADGVCVLRRAELAYRSFLSHNGHLLLYLLAQQCDAEWFQRDAHYLSRTLAAIATIARQSHGHTHTHIRAGREKNSERTSEAHGMKNEATTQHELVCVCVLCVQCRFPLCCSRGTRSFCVSSSCTTPPLAQRAHVQSCNPMRQSALSCSTRTRTRHTDIRTLFFDSNCYRSNCIPN
jgi:hypothetical protein